MTDNPKRKYRVNVTMNKKLYELISNKSKNEVRSVASVAKYYLIKGLESEGQENIDEYTE